MSWPLINGCEYKFEESWLLRGETSSQTLKNPVALFLSIQDHDHDPARSTTLYKADQRTPQPQQARETGKIRSIVCYVEY